MERKTDTHHQRQTNDLVRVLSEEVSTDLTELHSWGTTKPDTSHTTIMKETDPSHFSL